MLKCNELPAVHHCHEWADVNPLFALPEALGTTPPPATVFNTIAPVLIESADASTSTSAPTTVASTVAPATPIPVASSTTPAMGSLSANTEVHKVEGITTAMLSGLPAGTTATSLLADAQFTEAVCNTLRSQRGVMNVVRCSVEEIVGATDGPASPSETSPF